MGNARTPQDRLKDAGEHEVRAIDVARQEVARTHPGAGTISLVVLATLAVFYTLYFAAEILLPFLLAVILMLLLAPLRRALTDRLRLPAMLAALLLIVLLFAVLAGIVFALAMPAATWIAKAPQSLPELQHRLRFLGGPIRFLEHGMDEVRHVLQSTPPQGEQPAPMQPPQPPLDGVGLSVLQGTRAALGEIFTLAVMLFFLLSAGDSLLRRLVEILPTFGEKRRAVEIATEIERNVSGWLLTITAMNLLVGVANGVQMWAQGMPDPLLWGTLAFLLNYIPILGPFTGIVIFFFVGLFSKPALWQALLPPAIYLAVHTIEGETVTPLLLARRFTLNPVLVILSLFFWDWLWGVPGAFLSVPLLAIVKIVADRIPTLTPLGHFVGGAPQDAPGPKAPGTA
jgi:predicted PurR-regulated permease PerM